MIALDTNLLVYAQRSDTPQHRESRKVIERAIESDAGVASHTVVEFWSVVTSPSFARNPTSAIDAAAFLDALFLAGLQLFLPDESFVTTLVKQAKLHAVKGHRIHDLAIAVTAVNSGAQEIWTHDTGFVSLRGLKVCFPLHPRST